jgi:hypothetical protein
MNCERKTRATYFRGGRHVQPSSTLADYGGGAIARKQGDGVDLVKAFSRGGIEGLAAACGYPGTAGFRIRKKARGYFCGWMLLAWLREALPNAGQQSPVLARQNRAECSAGSRDAEKFARERMEGGASLGT